MKDGAARGLCSELRCKRRKAIDHSRCDMHRMRRWRANNPMKDAFYNLRSNAKARGIGFTIDFETFRVFALQCDYLNLKGQSGEGITVDRKDNLLGYVPGNIQPLTRAQNIIKQHKYDQKRIRAGLSWKNGEQEKNGPKK